MKCHFRFQKDEPVRIVGQEEGFQEGGVNVWTLLELHFGPQDEWFDHTHLEVLPCVDASVVRTSHFGEKFVVCCGSSEYHGMGYAVVVWIPLEAVEMRDCNEQVFDPSLLPLVPYGDLM